MLDVNHYSKCKPSDGTTKSSAYLRRDKQRVRYERKHAKLLAELEQTAKVLAGLDANDDRDDDANEDDLQRREDRYHTRRALENIRELVCGSRRKDDCMEHPAGRIFELVLDQWRRQGYPEDGVSIPFADIQKAAGRGRRNTHYLLESLRPYIHRQNRGCRVNLYRVYIAEYADD